MISPTVGMQFRHKTWQGTDGKPLTYCVTAVRKGAAYIKAEGEQKAKEYVLVEDWHKVYGGPA